MDRCYRFVGQLQCVGPHYYRYSPQLRAQRLAVDLARREDLLIGILIFAIFLQSWSLRTVPSIRKLHFLGVCVDQFEYLRLYCQLGRQERAEERCLDSVHLERFQAYSPKTLLKLD